MDSPGNCCIFGGLPEREEERQTKKCDLGSLSSSRRDSGQVLLGNVNVTNAKRADFLSVDTAEPPSTVLLFVVSVAPGQPSSGNSRGKQFICFKLHAILSGVMKPHATPLRPQEM